MELNFTQAEKRRVQLTIKQQKQIQKLYQDITKAVADYLAAHPIKAIAG